MSNSAERTFSSDFKRFFVRGLVILLPSVLTLWIVYAAYKFVDDRIAQPINRGVRIVMSETVPYWDPLRFDPSDEQVQEQLRGVRQDRRAPSEQAMRLELRRQNIFEWWNERWYMDFIGLIIAVVAVYTAGRLLGGYFGRRIYERLEAIITSIPVFKQVYPSVRQIVDFLFSEDQPIKFNRVVVVEYPRRGIWSVGFLTGPTLKSVAARSGKAVTVFIPSSPTPFTGYTITVPQEEVIEVPISVEEAIRFAVSGGVLIPDHQQDDHIPQIISDHLPEGLVPAQGKDQTESSEQDDKKKGGERALPDALVEHSEDAGTDAARSSSTRESGKPKKKSKGRKSDRNQSS